MKRYEYLTHEFITYAIVILVALIAWFGWQYISIDRSDAKQQQQLDSVYSACMQARGTLDSGSLWDKCYSLQQSYNVNFNCTSGSGNAYCWTEKGVE